MRPWNRQFQPTRVLRPSTRINCKSFIYFLFQPTRVLRPSTISLRLKNGGSYISTHKGPATLDEGVYSSGFFLADFNPQGSCDPRRVEVEQLRLACKFQPTRVLRPSTYYPDRNHDVTDISTHKGPATLDEPGPDHYAAAGNFNPQGSCDPRRALSGLTRRRQAISTHKGPATLDMTT